MVRAQERAPLLNRDDVEAGPAQYGANTSVADAASTVGEFLFTLSSTSQPIRLPSARRD